MHGNINFQKHLYSSDYSESSDSYFLQYFWYYILQYFICMILSRVIFEYKTSQKMTYLVALCYRIYQIFFFFGMQLRVFRCEETW